jgi:hypothetical protein
MSGARAGADLLQPGPERRAGGHRAATDPDGARRFWVSPEKTPGLLGLRDEADEYAAKEPEEGRDDSHMEVVKSNDHRLDALRYACMERFWDRELRARSAPTRRSHALRSAARPAAAPLRVHAPRPDPEGFFRARSCPGGTRRPRSARPTCGQEARELGYVHPRRTTRSTRSKTSRTRSPRSITAEVGTSCTRSSTRSTCSPPQGFQARKKPGRPVNPRRRRSDGMAGARPGRRGDQQVRRHRLRTRARVTIEGTLQVKVPKGGGQPGAELEVRFVAEHVYPIDPTWDGQGEPPALIRARPNGSCRRSSRRTRPRSVTRPSTGRRRRNGYRVEISRRA